MPNKITHGDVAHFLAVSREALDPWEIEAVFLMDAAWFDSQPKPGGAMDDAPKVSERPMSPALFDAIF